MTRNEADILLNTTLDLAAIITDDLGDGEARVDIFDEALGLAKAVKELHAHIAEGKDYPTVWDRKDALKPVIPEGYGFVLLDIALGKPPTFELYPGITAQQLATVALAFINTCPKCETPAWLNHECDLCRTCSHLIQRTHSVPGLL